MSQPFVGEIRMFGGNFAPAGWSFCNGSLLPISEFDALFSLIGTTYGGDGQTNFALPDLRGRIPVHIGQGPGLGNYVLGQQGGVEAVALTAQQVPAHTHPAAASTDPGSSASPGNAIWAATTTEPLYTAGPAAVPMAADALGPAGSNQPHTNVMPFLCVSFIISLYGIFPTPT